VTNADPDRYLDRLRDVYPELDDDITLYVTEALSAFNRRLYLAAVVMLGVAAEGMMYKLADAIRSSFQHPQEGESWYRRKIANLPALQQHNAIMSRVQPVQGDMPRRTRELLDTHLRGIYSLIRQHRNEVGHPTGVQKSRDEVLPLFYLFITQADLISDLCRWLREASHF
jgi:hypothetical protein